MRLLEFVQWLQRMSIPMKQKFIRLRLLGRSIFRVPCASSSYFSSVIYIYSRQIIRSGQIPSYPGIALSTRRLLPIHILPQIQNLSSHVIHFRHFTLYPIPKSKSTSLCGPSSVAVILYEISLSILEKWFTSPPLLLCSALHLFLHFLYHQITSPANRMSNVSNRHQSSLERHTSTQE